jgi:hypothetical protein
MSPIERCWAVLENYWNGAILDSVEAAVNWAANMSWKGIAPIVRLVETTYERGIKVSPEELKQYQPFWQRSANPTQMGYHDCPRLAGILFLGKSLRVAGDYSDSRKGAKDKDG